ncbi:hypothetical protein C0214_27170 (plasmid) [Methylobacterium sp. DM1]|uniref:Uncharacterized protein n=1 Tax=Methylorubrum aminovorans TaxID=269069 RepID=A0ABQ4UJH5_9HYPH|nr:hypothetical protein [Methylorubrum aminovorans]AWI91968.1 hypothetical protein C0214_27170 [Methylobacterium sp. DM1]GJE67435.1 hypothetical protein LNAOJCKE_4666 [Methylorubrum aminovorans]GMA74787.1 hypothetical protein GCM10025880_12040 [Methylorubrum aminovorans]
MSPVFSELRLLREAIEEDLDHRRIDENLGRGVYGYVGCLIRLVEDGDRDPARSLNEARSAAGFLRAVPRLPDPRPRIWSAPSCLA